MEKSERYYGYWRKIKNDLGEIERLLKDLTIFAG